MKILVIGAAGVIGRNVIPRLVERGHFVRAIVRDSSQIPFLEFAGANPVMGDIFDRDSLDRAARGCEAALHLATAIPKSGEGNWDLNDRIRREGTHNFLAAVTQNDVKKYIQQSITLVYGDRGQTIVDESAQLQPTPVSQSAVDMKEIVRASTLDWCILRGGLLYGAGTGREDAWRLAARQNRLMLPGDGSDYISLVHVVDMARAVVAATEDAPPRSVFNIVDDEPVSYKRLFTYIAAQLDMTAPAVGGSKFLPSLGCKNARAKHDLPWGPSFPSFRSGLA
jgi:nucleoside-diphosphate-sugar epimerase